MIHGKTSGKVEVTVTLETGEVRPESSLSIGGVFSRKCLSMEAVGPPIYTRENAR